MNEALQSVIGFAGAAGSSAALTLGCIHASRRLKLIADPRSDRWHKNPTPNTGGAAIFLSCAFMYLFSGQRRSPAIAVASLLIFILGFVDDRVRLRPRLKFMGQSLITASVIASGVVFRPTSWEFLNLVITFLWITGITNAFNLIDNMDGLCAGVTVIIAVSRCWLAFQNGDPGSAALLALIAGSFFGFLIFNYKPAKIFMGDAGSMFAGFTLASLAIAAPVPNTRVFLSAILCPALTFLYPIFDTALVSLMRRAAGTPISQGGRDHSSHRLASLGIGERKAVWILWTLAATGSIAGLLTYWMPVGVLAIGFVLMTATAVFGAFLASLPQYEMPSSAPVRSASVRSVLPRFRSAITLMLDVVLAGVALLAAFLLRWEDGFTGVPLYEFKVSLPVVLGCQAIACAIFKTFYLGWRWSGSRDILRIAETVLLSSSSAILAVWMGGLRGYSRGVIVIYALLLFSLMAAFRVSLRLLWGTLAVPKERRKVAIVATPSSFGFMVLMLRHYPTHDVEPVIILTQDPAMEESRVYGVPVRYVRENLTSVVQQSGAEALVVLADDNVVSEQRDIAECCFRLGLPVLEFRPLLTEATLVIAAHAAN